MPVASVILLILAILAIYKGWTQGLVMAVFTFVSYFIALALAFQLSGWLAGQLHEKGEGQDRFYGFLAFVLVMIAGILAVRLLGKLVEGAVKALMLGFVNRLLGVILFLFIYITLFSVTLFFAAKLGLFGGDSHPGYLDTLKAYGRWMVGMSSEWIPAVKNLFNDSIQFIKQNN